jgi:hypothetical protein
MSEQAKDHPTTWTSSKRALMAACRAIALATSPQRKLEALEAGARSMSIPVRHWFIKRVDVVDYLYGQAENCGLIDEFGESVVIDSIASNLEKFDAAEPVNGHVAFDDAIPPPESSDD